MNKVFASAAVAALALGAVAQAEFFNGQPIAIDGSAGPEFGGTTWGTWADEGTHAIGGESTFFDINAPTHTVVVQSSIIQPGHLSIILDFSDFNPGDFSFHTIDFHGLKQDGSIIGASGQFGSFAVIDDGNGVSWLLFGENLAANPVVKINIFQIPAPGALALLGVAGLTSRRRRA